MAGAMLFFGWQGQVAHLVQCAIEQGKRGAVEAHFPYFMKLFDNALSEDGYDWVAIWYLHAILLLRSPVWPRMFSP